MNGSLVIAERELPAILRTRQTVWILLAVATAFAVLAACRRARWSPPSPLWLPGSLPSM